MSGGPQPSGSAGVRVRYRSGRGGVVDTTLDRVAVDDLAAAQPIREFRWYEGRRHYSGWYWSATNADLVVYESRLELARIMLADFDPSVVTIAAQPFQLAGPDGSRIRRHVPDLLLVNADGGVTVVDVKAPERREDPAVRAVMEWTGRTVALRGWGFEEWCGAPGQLMANVRFLAGYRRRVVVDEGLIPRVLAVVGEGAAIVDLERSLRPVPSVLVRPVVLHLVWCGRLLTDLDTPLEATSVVRPALAGAVAG